MYFVTICAQDRRCLFGAIVGSEPRLNPAGRMVTSWWEKLPDRFPSVMLDSFVLMPNHLHGIIHITDVGAMPGRPHGAAPTLGTMVAWFKSMTTNAYLRGVKGDGWPAFKGRFWQRNYYEHIIRSERALDPIREYIFNNPACWDSDPENPTLKSIVKPTVVWQV